MCPGTLRACEQPAAILLPLQNMLGFLESIVESGSSGKGDDNDEEEEDKKKSEKKADPAEAAGKPLTAAQKKTNRKLIIRLAKWLNWQKESTMHGPLIETEDNSKHTMASAPSPLCSARVHSHRAPAPLIARPQPHPFPSHNLLHASPSSAVCPLLAPGPEDSGAPQVQQGL